MLRSYAEERVKKYQHSYEMNENVVLFYFQISFFNCLCIFKQCSTVLTVSMCFHSRTRIPSQILMRNDQKRKEKIRIKQMLNFGKPNMQTGYHFSVLYTCYILLDYTYFHFRCVIFRISANVI